MSKARFADSEHQSISRRTFLAAAAALAVPAAVHGESVNQNATISGAGGVIPEPIQQGSPDLPTNAFFEYGVYEGIPASTRCRRTMCISSTAPRRQAESVKQVPYASCRLTNAIFAATGNAFASFPWQIKLPSRYWTRDSLSRISASIQPLLPGAGDRAGGGDQY